MSTILSKAYKLQRALKNKGFVVIIDKQQKYNFDTDTTFSIYIIKELSREYNESKDKYYNKYTEIYSSYKPQEIVKYLANIYKSILEGDT